MQQEDLQRLIETVVRTKTETQTLELKAAKQGCPSKLFDTLSSFSNQDEGGIILFGIDEERGYQVVGVYDPHDLQQKITEQCNQMEPVVRALFSVTEYHGKTVVSCEIPGTEITNRPVFYRGKGRLKGAYVRVGESDQPMTEYEVYSFVAFRERKRDELRLVDKGQLTLIDESRVQDYLERIKKEREHLSQNVTDDEICELMGITQDGKLTLLGLLIFSKYPQGLFPQLSITAISLPGNEKGEEGERGERFIDNKRLTGSISDMLDAAVAFVERNSRTSTIIGEDGKRKDELEYPIKAVREAILNALIHRDYSIYTENIPIQIEMYRDRLEIINSGGLYGKLSVDALGRMPPEVRNAALVNVLEVLDVTENRYSGIPTMRRECQKLGLPEPEFYDTRGEFKVVFRNRYYPYQDVVKEDSASFEVEPTSKLTKDHAQPVTMQVLAFCETPRSRNEIIDFVGQSRNHVMTQIVLPLVESGKLRLTLPEKPQSPYQKYVRA